MIDRNIIFIIHNKNSEGIFLNPVYILIFIEFESHDI